MCIVPSVATHRGSCRAAVLKKHESWRRIDICLRITCTKYVYMYQRWAHICRTCFPFRTSPFPSSLFTSQDILHTYDKFVGPIPVDFEEGTRALHDLLPRLFDSKVAMSKATEAGLAFPQTVLGGAFRWLREKFPKHKEADVTADESAPGATNHEANGDARAATTETDNPEVAVAEAGEGKAASERRRQAWDAAFAPGFEQRYAAGGQEHEAGYDAYLTGCCFAAAATLGLGVSVEELKALSGRGETPAALVPVSNTVPLYRMVRIRGV